MDRKCTALVGEALRLIAAVCGKRDTRSKMGLKGNAGRVWAANADYKVLADALRAKQSGPQENRDAPWNWRMSAE